MQQVDYAALAKEAGAISSTPPPASVDAHGVPLDAPRDARGQIITSKDEEPGVLDKLNEMLGPLAHPQTLADFARLLTLPVDSVRKAAATALSMAASRGPAGSAIAATGRGLEAVGNSRAARAAEAAGGAEAAFKLDPKGLAVAAAPTVLKATGRVLQRAGAFVKGAPPMSAAAVPPTIGEAAEAAPVATSAVAPAAAATPAEAAPVAEAPAAWTPAKLKLTADELQVAKHLEAAGKSDQEIREAIEAARELQKRLGTPTPTAAQKKFPKGMRGRSTGGD